jgi:hypothetical protein
VKEGALLLLLSISAVALGVIGELHIFQQKKVRPESYEDDAILDLPARVGLAEKQAHETNKEIKR